MQGKGNKATRILIAGSIVVLLTCVLYFGRSIWLLGMGHFLVVKDPLERADAIYVLNGDPNTRPFEAVRLYKQGLAPRVVIAKAENSMTNVVNLTPNTTDLCIEVLKSGGITGDRLIELSMPGGVTSTLDEARLLKAYANQNGIHKVIVVTSDFHSRRAKWIIRKVVNSSGVKIIMRPTPNPKYGENNWWHKEDGVIGCQNEYIKLLFYLVHYRNLAYSDQKLMRGYGGFQRTLRPAAA